MSVNKPETIDEYVRCFPVEVQAQLEAMRAIIRQAAPKAEEAISYAMPTFRQAGNLVHFAAFKNHLGFYPGASGIAQYEAALAKFPTSKGAVRFPLDRPLPKTLISKMVKFRIQENEARAKIRPKAGRRNSPS